MQKWTDLYIFTFILFTLSWFLFLRSKSSTIGGRRSATSVVFLDLPHQGTLLSANLGKGWCEPVSFKSFAFQSWSLCILVKGIVWGPIPHLKNNKLVFKIFNWLAELENKEVMNDLSTNCQVTNKWWTADPVLYFIEIMAIE